MAKCFSANMLIREMLAAAFLNCWTETDVSRLYVKLSKPAACCSFIVTALTCFLWQKANPTSQNVE